jgi:hypothetical protein
MADVKLTREDALKNLKTPNGKTVRIEPIRGTHCYKLSWDEGGEAPKEFESIYTGITHAQNAAIAFLGQRWDAEARKKTKTA